MDIKNYLKAKQRDIVLLHALRRKLPSITQQKDDELGMAMRSQQPGAIASARCNLKVVTNIGHILPQIIETIHIGYDTLRERLLRIKELQEQIEEGKGRKTLDMLQKSSLDTGVEDPGDRGGQVSSLRSTLCVQAHYYLGYNRSVAAEEELSKFQAHAENAPFPKMVSLKEEYKSLLKFTDAGWSSPF